MLSIGYRSRGWCSSNGFADALPNSRELVHTIVSEQRLRGPASLPPERHLMVLCILGGQALLHQVCSMRVAHDRCFHKILNLSLQRLGALRLVIACLFLAHCSELFHQSVNVVDILARPCLSLPLPQLIQPSSGQFHALPPLCNKVEVIIVTIFGFWNTLGGTSSCGLQILRPPRRTIVFAHAVALQTLNNRFRALRSSHHTKQCAAPNNGTHTRGPQELDSKL